MNLKLLVLFLVASIFSQFLGNVITSNEVFILIEVVLLAGMLFAIKYIQAYLWREIFYFLLASFTHPIIFAIALLCAFPFGFYVETNVHQLNLILFWSILMIGTYLRFMGIEWLMQKNKLFYLKSELWHDFLAHHKILSPFLILTFVFMFPLEGNVVGFIYFPAGLFLTLILYPLYFFLSLTLYFSKLKEKLQWFIKAQGTIGLILFLGICGYLILNNLN